MGGEVLIGSLAGGRLARPGLDGVSILGAGFGSTGDLLMVVHDVLGTLRELGLVLFGRGGTA